MYFCKSFVGLNLQGGNKIMKVVFSGLESQGKSLKLAMVAADLLLRNHVWLKKSGVVRPIISNLKFSEEFEKYASDLGIPIKYWVNLDDLVKYEQADIIIDEIGNYFDSRFWQDLSLDVRRWITQGAKCGIEMYGSAQDFAQVDKAFRRLVNSLYEVSKVIGSPRPSPTKPPIKRIWGLCMIKELDPRAYKEDDKRVVTSFGSKIALPRFFFIERRYCEIFDTTQKIERGRYPKLRHEERDCELDSCSFHKVFHY